MPEYESTAPYGMTYPESKDAQGRNLGLVQPGDIRDLDEPPDQWWREVTDEDRARLAADEAGADAGDEDGAAGEDGEPGDAGPSGPTPAPPAVITGT